MISEGLHSAIEKDELELYYQPQVELSGRSSGWRRCCAGTIRRGCCAGQVYSDRGIERKYSSDRTMGDRRGLSPDRGVATAIHRSAGRRREHSAGQFKLASDLDSWSPKLWPNTASLQTGWNWN